MKQYPVKTVDIPRGETLAYREAGSGKPLVLIHGNMSSSVFFQTTMEALEKDFHIIAPDLRGFGDSSYNQPFDSLRELALDVEQLLDAVGIEKPYDVLGWSTGGGVALELAADRPEDIGKVILLDSAPINGYPMFKKGAGGQPILTEPLKTKEEVAADPVQVLPALAAFAGNDRDMMRMIWNATIYNLKQPPEEEYELYLDAIMKQRNLVDVDYALLTFNMTHTPSLSAVGTGRIDLLRGPIIMLQGEKDIVVPLAWAQAMKETLGDRATLIIFADVGHSVITDDPELFYKTLREVLS